MRSQPRKCRLTGAAVVRTSDDRPRPPRVPVVVELHSDGFCQVFGPDFLAVQFVHRMNVTPSPEVADLADEYHANELPLRHRQFYLGPARAATMPRCLSAEAELERLWRLEFLRTLTELTRGGRP